MGRKRAAIFLKRKRFKSNIPNDDDKSMQLDDDDGMSESLVSSSDEDGMSENLVGSSDEDGMSENLASSNEDDDGMSESLASNSTASSKMDNSWTSSSTASSSTGYSNIKDSSEKFHCDTYQEDAWNSMEMNNAGEYDSSTPDDNDTWKDSSVDNDSYLSSDHDDAEEYDFTSNSAEMPEDADSLFCDKSELPYTQRYFLDHLQLIVAQYNLPNKAVEQMLLLLDECSNSSIKVGVKRSKNGRRVCRMNAYIGNDYRDERVDVCENECISFIGDNKDAIMCPNCKTFRYNPCTYSNCAQPEVCDPVTNNHSVFYRTPKNSYYYRSLITLLIDLVKADCKREESKKLFSYAEKRETSKNKISDILDGVQAQKNLLDMRANFEICQKNHPNNILIEKSILLSEFYDGAKIFNRSNMSVWPLCVSILNFDPTARNTIGVGLFLIALHALNNKDLCLSIFEKQFVPELQKLGQGIIFDLGNNGIKVFLQARLISHSLDTPAFADVTQLQCAGSLKACLLCNIVTGASRGKHKHPYGKIVYFGHRILLPAPNWLRFHGMSGQCCPKGYYESNDPDHDATVQKIANDCTSATFAKIKFDPKYAKLCSNYKSKVVCTSNSKMSDIEQIDTSMFQSGFSYEIFSNYLEFANCDWREPRDFKRRENKFYEAAANTSEAGKKCDGEKWKCENGVNGRCVFSDVLGSSIEESFCYDPFHAMKNFCDDIIDLFSCKMKQACLKAHHVERRFLRVEDVKKLPFKLENKCKNVADSVLNCILIPIGLKSTFASKNILNTPGHAKGMDKIRYKITYMTFCLSFTKLQKEYRNLFALSSATFADLLSPCFSLNKNDPSSIDLLVLKVAEMLSLFEGMIPDTYHHFSHHQLLDIAYFIRRLGPVRSWWTLPGERLMRPLKAGIPIGGPNPLKTLKVKFVAKERCATYSYTPVSSSFDNDNIYSDNHVRLLGHDEEYTAEYLTKRRYIVANSLFEALYNAASTCSLYDSLAEIAQHSPFFHLYSHYVNFHKKVGTFTLFLRKIDTVCGKNCCKKSFKSSCNTSWMLLRDVATSLSSWTPKKLYTKAIIKGVEFTARGQEYHEVCTCKSDQNSKSSVRCSCFCRNDLAKVWSDGEQYSSWCKIKHWTSSQEVAKFTVVYGQLNYFFRINWVHEDLLTNVAMTAVTVRMSQLQELRRTNFISITDAETINKNIYFVPVYVIESTNIATCGTALHEKKGERPILITRNQETAKINKHFYEFNKKKIAKLYLIDMQPERQYVDCTLADSKKCEKDC